MRSLGLLWLFIAAVAAAGEPPPPAAQDEIRHLLATLERSDCEFSRNGSWYAAGEARRHLGRKYEQALGRGLIRSSEDFIRGVASGSSLSGEPYLVRCKAAQATPSAVWLNRELMRYRNRASAGN
jgi:Family of unknown function (DUF5329)